jgi:hypothetical protein
MAITPRTVTQPLVQPVFDTDVRLVNFFNGRMLSAEDLSREQDANREERRRLGRAIGDGVAYGLEVTATVGVDRVAAPAVTINAGLAVNRRGQTLALASSVDVVLKQPPLAQTASGDIQTFAVCDPVDPNTYVAGAGAYLLTIGEAEGKQGLAPVSGLGNIQASCNTKYLVPGVRFRLIPLTLAPADLNEPNLLRNRLAYRCLAGGPGESDGLVDDGFVANPFGPPITEYGVIDRLRPHLPDTLQQGTWLQTCEVPLALLYLTATNGLVFVDMWAVRRRIIAPSADSSFPLLTSDRRLAEGEAMFLQFQSQIADMLLAGVPLAPVAARDLFAFLPPVGLLPVGTGGRPLGFNYNNFFSRMTCRNPIFIEGAQLRPLLREGLSYPPIDTNSGVVVWLYLVRENAQLTLTGKPGQSYLVFASGHTPYRGEARYNVHHWNFGNVA